MKIAVTGSGGWVGAAVCRALRDLGASVVALSRGATGIRRFDLEDPGWRDSWPEALTDCDAIVHCAAHVHRPGKTRDEKARFELINVKGTQRLIEAASLASVRRLVFVSSIAVYDWTYGGEPRGEEATLRPLTAYGESKLAAERIVQQAISDWRIARLGTVFGEGDHANFAKLAAALRTRRMIIPGNGSARKSVIVIQRVGEVIARLAITERLHGRVINVAAPCAPTLAEICNGFAKVCGFAPARKLPTGLLWPVAKAGDILQALGRSFPLTTNALTTLTSDTVVSTTALQTLFPDLKWGNFVDDLASAREYYLAPS